jgi:hypothetical protein
MRTAIRKHPRAKQWAKVNCEDNFCLAVYSTAEHALLDVIGNSLDTHKSYIVWYNDLCSPMSKLRAYVLTTCQEMYKVLRA